MNWKRVSRGLFIICVLSGFVGNLNAQGSPLISMSFDFMPYRFIETPELGFETLETRLANPRFEINIPSRLSPTTSIVNGVRYSYLQFDYRGPVPSTAIADKLHALSYHFAITTVMGNLWAATIFAEPGIASDFEEVTSEHLRFAGGVIFSGQLNPATRIGFGGIVQNNFGQFLPLPVFILDRRGSGSRLSLFLPTRAEFLFTPGGGMVEFGVQANVTGNQYRLGRITALMNPIIQYSVITVGPALNVRLSRPVTLVMAGGAAVLRRFDVKDGDVDIADIDLETGPYLRATFEIR